MEDIALSGKHGIHILNTNQQGNPTPFTDHLHSHNHPLLLRRPPYQHHHHQHNISIFKFFYIYIESLSSVFDGLEYSG